RLLPVRVGEALDHRGHLGPWSRTVWPATRLVRPWCTSQKESDQMKNVEMTVAGNILTIKVDLSKEFGPSASGKTIIVASTEGNITIPEREEKVGLNVYRKK